MIMDACTRIGGVTHFYVVHALVRTLPCKKLPGYDSYAAGRKVGYGGEVIKSIKQGVSEGGRSE